MIRTRDFFLYIVILVFVLMAAVYTGFTSSAAQGMMQFVRFGQPAEDRMALTPESDTREGELLRMREKVAAGEGVLADAPPEFLSVDQKRAAAVATGSMDGQESSFAGMRSVQYCAVGLANPLVAQWPTEYALRLSEGEWVVYGSEVETVTVGSTTSERSVEVPFVALPIRSVRTGFDSCIPDTLVGVTSTGAPLVNTTAAQYAATSPGTVVGYARDGFTIYGPVTDDSLLDACGGVSVNGRYQYHVRPNENFILGCYAGIPVRI